jgi:hypothetical protein
MLERASSPSPAPAHTLLPAPANDRTRRGHRHISQEPAHPPALLLLLPFLPLLLRPFRLPRAIGAAVQLVVKGAGPPNIAGGIEITDPGRPQIVLKDPGGISQVRCLTYKGATAGR